MWPIEPSQETAPGLGTQQVRSSSPHLARALSGRRRTRLPARNPGLAPSESRLASRKHPRYLGHGHRAPGAPRVWERRTSQRSTATMDAKLRGLSVDHTVIVLTPDARHPRTYVLAELAIGSNQSRSDRVPGGCRDVRCRTRVHGVSAGAWRRCSALGGGWHGTAHLRASLDLGGVTVQRALPAAWS